MSLGGVQMLLLIKTNIKRHIRQPFLCVTLFIIALALGFLCRFSCADECKSIIVMSFAVGVIVLKRIWSDTVSGYRASLLASGVNNGVLAAADLMSWIFASVVYSVIVGTVARLSFYHSIF